ncbi:MAG: metallophosphoesterase [Chlorogloeopsis fritschii C42_A2020_084]|uniref:metallophosphoesterase family protein n=1 Tax=Chlorogloeopsis fritschii TaxID=1124 RepID=UPI0019F49737|nr:metallophosphoesterase [Chlorogloeopsis fritschii]MBF2006641.1 metallophosphoesterase [Chlorogloeopsis fritschii C42_A2020_084]
MKLKRRQFLFLSSLSAFGIGFLGVISRYASNNTDELETAIAATPTKKDLLLRFVSVADTGTGAGGQYAVARAMANYHSKNPYKLVVLAGDNIYNNGEIEKIGAVFERPYASLLKRGVKFQAVLGNHDIRTANGDLQLKYVGFNMKGRYYTFRQDKVQFFALDTNGNADWKNQLIWLEKELSRSNAPWKIVFGHHPIYASGAYGSNPQFIKNFTPLFQKYGVQLYINGHEHHYERTRSINGTTYLICGGGAGTRPVGKNEWTEYSAERLSFAAYEVYPDRIEISGIGTDRRVFDRGIVPLRAA